MHSAMVELRLSALEGEACELDTQEVLTPSQTYQKLLRNGTEKVKFTEMAGRIAGVMLVPYPPGIPVCMPGERLGDLESPVIKLILALEEFGKRFPGFEREVHGIEVDPQGDYWMRAVIEQTNGKRSNAKNRPPSSAPPVKRKRRTGVKPGAKPELTPLDSTLNEQR